MESLGSRLRQLRKERNLTLSDVAVHFDAQAITISRYETGAREVKSESLNKFATFYNVSTDYLLGRTDIKNYEEVKNDAHQSLSRVMSNVKNNDSVLFDGEPMNDEEVTSFIESLEVVIQIANKKRLRNR